MYDENIFFYYVDTAMLTILYTVFCFKSCVSLSRWRVLSRPRHTLPGSYGSYRGSTVGSIAAPGSFSVEVSTSGCDTKLWDSRFNASGAMSSRWSCARLEPHGTKWGLAWLTLYGSFMSTYVYLCFLYALSCLISFVS